MRAFTCFALAAFALAGCGGDTTADNSAEAEENVSNAVVPTNDVTAIDAATGAAANMAPDVPFVLNESEAGDAGSEEATAEPSRPAPRPRRAAPRAASPELEPAAEPEVDGAEAETP